MPVSAGEFTFKERFKFSLVGEAFNLLNHTNILGVNTTQYSLGSTPGSTTLSPVATFLTPTTTSNGLVGARQLQVSARFSF